MRRRGLNSRPQTDENTGSPQAGGPVFIAVGFLRRPHGFNGEMLMDLLTDFPERIRKGRKVYLGETHLPAQIHSARGHDSSLLVTIQGIDTSEAAGELRNTMVYVRADELPSLPAGEYYHHQLIGLAVYNQTETLLGTLSEILETGANDVYVIKKSDGEEILVPVIKGVILSVDLEKREMRINPPEWE